MREDSQENTTSGQKPEMTFEITVDAKTNEFVVRIAKGLEMIVLNEAEARWAQEVLIDFIPLKDRLTK